VYRIDSFAREGAKVVVSDLNLDAAKSAADEIRKIGGDAIAVKTDVSSEVDVTDSINTAVKTFGKVDILLNNAGFQFITPIVDCEYSMFQKMLNVHVGGAFLCTRQVMRHMAERAKLSSSGKLQRATILNMGSVHSKTVSPLKAPYCTAKHALLGLTRSTALEGAQYGIRANAVLPGFVKTKLVEAQIPEQAKALGISEEDVVKKVMLKNTVDGEFSTVEDIAEACVFLAANPTNVLTGQSIILSHGWHME
jgi:3-hydroxybutyrate dehydrogenase